MNEIIETTCSIIAALAMWFFIILINRMVTIDIEKSNERNRD